MEHAKEVNERALDFLRELDPEFIQTQLQVAKTAQN